MPSFVRTGGGYRAVEVQHADQQVGGARVSYADPPAASRLGLAERDDVPAGVDHRARDPRKLELLEGLLRDPTLGETRGVDAARHAPGVEPASGHLACQGAAPQDLSHAWRCVREFQLPPAQPAECTLRLPRAELLVGLVQRHARCPQGGARSTLVEVPRAQMDRHHRAHHMLSVPDHWLADAIVPAGSWSSAD
jgi:hypothetical protein